MSAVERPSLSSAQARDLHRLFPSPPPPTTLAEVTQRASRQIEVLRDVLRRPGPVCLRHEGAYEWLCSAEARGLPLELVLRGRWSKRHREYELVRVTRAYVWLVDIDPSRVCLFSADDGRAFTVWPDGIVAVQRSDGELLESWPAPADDLEPQASDLPERDDLVEPGAASSPGAGDSSSPGLQPDYGRAFALVRDDDETGVSGIGMVAWGFEFPDGKCVTRWKGDSTAVRQTCVWDSIADVETIHGHHGKTRVVWEDPAARERATIPLLEAPAARLEQLDTLSSGVRRYESSFKPPLWQHEDPLF